MMCTQRRMLLLLASVSCSALLVQANPYNPQYTLGLNYHADVLDIENNPCTTEDDQSRTTDGVVDDSSSVTRKNESSSSPSTCLETSLSILYRKSTLNSDIQNNIASLMSSKGALNDEELKERIQQIMEADFTAKAEQDQEETDDDDEDDDGSCSMLSTSAYYRNSGFSNANTAAVMAVRGGGIGQVAESEMFRRLFIAALVTILYEGSLGHILEFIKIVMQTSPLGTSYGTVLKTITADKGLPGLWDGFVPWGVIQALFKGSVFGIAHHAAKGYLLALANDGLLPRQLALTMAGGIGGGFQGYVLSPTLLLKTRVMTDPVFREQMSMLRTTALSLKIGFDVITQEGLLALMKGSNIFALKRVFDWATRFYFSDVAGKVLLSFSSSDVLTPGEKITADLIGGFFSTVSTLPLDVMVAKTQDAKKAGVKTSALQMFKDELKEGGWKGLKASYLQGFEARLLHVCFTTVAMKTGTGMMYDLLYNK